MSNLAFATAVVRALTEFGERRRTVLLRAILALGVKRPTAHSYLHIVEKRLAEEGNPVVLIAAKPGRPPAIAATGSGASREKTTGNRRSRTDRSSARKQRRTSRGRRLVNAV